MAKKLLTVEQDAYLRQICSGRLDDVIAEMMNKEFGLSLSASQIRYYRKNKKITKKEKAKYIPKFRLTTPEQDEWMREHIKGKTLEETQAMLKEKFGIEMSLSQVKSWKQNRHISSGLDTRFKKGQPPANANTPISKEAREKMSKTWFRLGNRPHNTLPVGTEILLDIGYIKIKVAEPDVWMLKQRYVWELHNGKIPKGHKVIMLDGDRTNTDISNLRLVRNDQLAVINNRFKCTNPELFELVKLATNVVLLNNEKKREVKEQKEKQSCS